jgi:hypothetical protein
MSIDEVETNLCQTDSSKMSNNTMPKNPLTTRDKAIFLT